MQLTLKTLREIYGMRQYELAFKSDLCTTTISTIESGKRRRITLKCLKRLSNAFGLKTNELMSLFEIEENGGNAQDIRNKFQEFLGEKGVGKEMP